VKRLAIGLLFLGATVAAFAAGKAEHVVVIVLDGLRADLVNNTNTPTLVKLARDGVFFANHHSIYPTSTEVNGVALATGAFPNRNGVVANREYRPAIDPLKRIAIEEAATIGKGDEVTGDQYLRLATLPEILRHAGKSVAIAGTKPVALLFDRFDREHVKLPNPLKFEAPNTLTDAGTIRALIGSLWSNGVPAFSLLWLSDPDTTQHATWPGADKALVALKGADANLALVLGELDARGERQRTDVFVVSDHGFSTVMGTIDMADTLAKAGFSAVREFKAAPKIGDVMVVGNGGSVLLYVIGHEKALTRRIVEFLQQQEFTGVVLTREPMPGAFTLEQARLNSPDAPDIVVSLRWTEEKNQAGMAGLSVSDGATYGKVATGLGRGGHSSLSRYDIHNTLIAAGPDFPAGQTNTFPSSNADLAPTILSLLGVKLSQAMDGRLLTAYPFAGPRSQTLGATNGNWRQYLNVTEFGGALYLDEGNGSSQVIHNEEKRVSP
jgi:arylsulfatase A-like enzyme